MKKVFGFGWREHRSGFVQNQYVRFMKEYFQNFSPLTFTDRQVLNLRSRIDGEAECGGDFLKSLFGSIQVQEETVFETQDKVFYNRQIGYQGKVLIDHADAQSQG